MDDKITKILLLIDQNTKVIKEMLRYQRRIHDEIQNSMKVLQKSFQLICNAQFNFSEDLSEWAGTLSSMDIDLF